MVVLPNGSANDQRFALSADTFDELGFDQLAARVVDGDGPAGTVLDDQLTIACATGAIAPSLVQRAGRGVMSPAELLRGFSIPAGTVLR